LLSRQEQLACKKRASENNPGENPHMTRRSRLQVTIVQEKECVLCLEPKEPGDFHDRHAKCKPCHRKVMRENYWKILRHKKKDEDKHSNSGRLLKTLRLV